MLPARSSRSRSPIQDAIAEANQYLAAAAMVPVGRKRRHNLGDDTDSGERRARPCQKFHYWRNQAGRFQRVHVGSGEIKSALDLPDTIAQLPSLYTYGCCPECVCSCRDRFNLALPQQNAIWIIDRVHTHITLAHGQGRRYVHLRRFNSLFRAQCPNTPARQPDSPHQEYISVQHLMASQPPATRVQIARSEFFEAVCIPQQFHFAATDITVAAILLPDRAVDWKLGGVAPRWGIPYYEMGALLECWPVDGRDGLHIQTKYGRFVADLVMLPVEGVFELALRSFQTRDARTRSSEAFPNRHALIHLLAKELPALIDEPKRRCARRNMLNHLLGTRTGYPPADQFVFELAKMLLYGGPLLWCDHQRTQLVCNMSILQPPQPFHRRYQAPRIMCCVCLDSDRVTHNVLVPCGHLVCSRCLFIITDYWYQVRTTVGVCPVCRQMYSRHLPVAPDDYERLAIAKTGMSASMVMEPTSSRLAAALSAPTSARPPAALLTLPATTRATIVPMTPRASALVATAFTSSTPTSPSPPSPPPMVLNVPPLYVLDPCGHVVSSSNRTLAHTFPVEKPYVCHQCHAVAVGLVRVYPQVDEGYEEPPTPPPATTVGPKPRNALQRQLSEMILDR